MAYAVLTVIVDGALESEETYHDDALLNEAIAQEIAAAEGNGYRTEIDVRYHEHDDDIECECAQYETDGHPAYVINGDADEKGRWQ